MGTEIDRRTFLKGAAAAAAGVGLAVKGAGTVVADALRGNRSKPIQPIPTRPLGKTGVQVTLLGLGGLFSPSVSRQRDEAVQIVNRAIDLGINCIDTAANYDQGRSETTIGHVMRTRRKEVFLASKSHDYTYDGTMRLFEESLKRLQTDYLDLYQHHYLGHFGQPDQLRSKNSARQAFERLRSEGVIRFIGVTSHSSRVLADVLQEYPYDCALITLNPAREVMDDPSHLDRFFRVARARQVGVIAMKVFARGLLIERGHSIKELFPYALSFPVATAVIGMSSPTVLEENVRLAREFVPLRPAELRRMERTMQAKG